MKSTKDTHQDCARAWDVMPWVLQGTAPQEQSAWLTDHLARCESCRDEFAQQSRLRLALTLPAGIQLDPEAGIEQLMKRIDAEEPGAATPRVRAGHWLTRALVAAVLVQATGIGILGMELWSSGGGHSPYRTLSSPAQQAVPGAIRVVPEPGMKLVEWNTLLHSLQLEVVNGPNDVGAYTVVPTRALTTQETLQQLRATHGIRLAEPAANP